MIMRTQLRTALTEQRRLRQALHHRVANSLQIMASLVALQARPGDSAETRHSHSVIQAQIHTLALMQHWLDADAGGGDVDLAGLVMALCKALEPQLAAARQADAAIHCTVAAARLHPDQVIPLGFLITEIALLASRHSPAGPLAISLLLGTSAGMLELALAAPGFAGADPLAADAGTANARIITAMLRQLHAQWTHDGLVGICSASFASSAA
ncbi:MAG: histidine kinase dimerization/phosphoacceptor domain -containing protein [Sphingomonadales bacterium]